MYFVKLSTYSINIFIALDLLGEFKCRAVKKGLVDYVIFQPWYATLGWRQSNQRSAFKYVDSGPKVEGRQTNQNSAFEYVDSGSKVEGRQTNQNYAFKYVDSGSKVEGRQTNQNYAYKYVDSGQNVAKSQNSLIEFVI